jgi:SAM-dependent methyltransferase
MTEEMLALARDHAAEAGVSNAEFLAGRIEDIPLPDASVDVVISNCVIALSTDKTAVFTEIARVLRPGGRLGITDILADDTLTDTERAQRASNVECLATALTAEQYQCLLQDAGLRAIAVHQTHAVGDKLHSMIIRASKPEPVRVTAMTADHADAVLSIYQAGLNTGSKSGRVCLLADHTTHPDSWLDPAGRYPLPARVATQRNRARPHPPPGWTSPPVHLPLRGPALRPGRAVAVRPAAHRVRMADGRAWRWRVAMKLSAASSTRSRSPVASRSSNSPRIVAMTSVAVRVAVAGSTSEP